MATVGRQSQRKHGVSVLTGCVAIVVIQVVPSRHHRSVFGQDSIYEASRTSKHHWLLWKGVVCICILWALAEVRQLRMRCAFVLREGKHGWGFLLWLLNPLTIIATQPGAAWHTVYCLGSSNDTCFSSFDMLIQEDDLSMTSTTHSLSFNQLSSVYIWWRT